MGKTAAAAGIMALLDANQLLQQYFSARDYVVAAGFGKDIDLALAASFRPIREQFFLSNLAWVVFASGFSEAVLRSLFPQLSAAFLQFETGSRVRNNREACRAHALTVFNNERKTDAVLWAAEHVAKEGFDAVLSELEQDPIGRLQEFPMIGPITSFHLAKNLGYPVAKADRHVQRLSDRLGFRNAQQLCQYLAEWSGDPVPVVDVVLWRYATLAPDYLTDFGSRGEKPIEAGPNVLHPDGSRL